MYFNMCRKFAVTIFLFVIILASGVIRIQAARAYNSRFNLPFYFKLIKTQEGGEVIEYARIIPMDIKDWKAVEKEAVYDRKTLYDYMNGGAEVYLAFDFRHVFVRKYKGPGDNEIALDIYHMGTSEEAFGVFSCDREDEPAGIGQDSEYGFGLLRFWQGPYFVSITAMGDDKAAEPVILELGKIVSSKLGPSGRKPDILDVLPREKLIKNRVSFFHSNVNLNNRFFIASENILNLDRKTDCVFAEYETIGEGRGFLLVVRYTDTIKAKAAHESFLGDYMPEGSKSGIAQMENKTWTLARIEENIVSIVFEAPSKQWASKLQSSIKYGSSYSSGEEKHE